MFPKAIFINKGHGKQMLEKLNPQRSSIQLSSTLNRLKSLFTYISHTGEWHEYPTIGRKQSSPTSATLESGMSTRLWEENSLHLHFISHTGEWHEYPTMGRKQSSPTFHQPH
ncbi:hypothetical protein RRG08_013905 [Elysia crispata]|uniref:Uncharacterized protein n=1 Tax=Elysia crispata TaxID=231223 RepID=A0AAE0XTF4_9GAST|nr:hypothetical protein RRG08_013905 [Elysia crispata]